MGLASSHSESVSIQINRKCIKLVDLTHSAKTKVHKVTSGVGVRQADKENRERGKMMVIQQLSRPIPYSLQHELTFYIQSTM